MSGIRDSAYISQLVNDEHWPFPEYKIRWPGCNRRTTKLGADWLYRIANSSQAARLAIGQMLRYSEGASLDDVNKNGEDFERSIDQQGKNDTEPKPENTERLKQLRGRIVCASRPSLSGCVLFLICLFAYMASVKWPILALGKRDPLGILLAAFFAVYVLRKCL